VYRISYLDGLSGIILAVSYQIEDLGGREAVVTLLFVFASPAGSSANLIASEIFPTASRTIVLFVMFMVSMLGGMCGVWFDNYIVASIMMSGAGVAAFFLCPNSENKSLEEIEKM
jgi:Na+(H+)/acetate symporter ActP